MSDNVFTYDEVLDLPIDAVWKALQRTSEVAAVAEARLDELKGHFRHGK